MTTFEVLRGDIRTHRLVTEPVPAPAEGQAVLRVDRFAMTANNISYAAFADMLGYWDHFPTEQGWGRLPAFGHSDVVASSCPDLPIGTRIFGYFPMSTHLVITPTDVTARDLNDGSPHRQHLASAYLWMQRVEGDPDFLEAERMLLWPLFATSFLVEDMLEDDGLTGVPAVLSSASSKTAIGAAFLIRERKGTHLIGLTSPGNADFVRALRLYDEVLLYEDVPTLSQVPCTYLDFAGSSELRAAVHGRLGDVLLHSAVIGGSHWQDATGAGNLPGVEPRFFFAPTRMGKRTEDWGRPELDARIAGAFARYTDWLRPHLHIEARQGAEAVSATYDQLLTGAVDPSRGLLLSMRG